MRNILCYGDSNTWGWDPETRQRFPPGVRWPGVMAAALGPGFRVIEEGLNGRTTVWTDPHVEYRNGKHYLEPCLESHKPLDTVVLMLGTNDLKYKFSATAGDIARGAGALIEMALRSRAGVNDGAPSVLLVAPPPLGRLTEFAEIFDGGEPKSRLLAPRYAAIASELGCDFLDAGSIVRSSDIDGVHLEADAHRALGLAIASFLRDRC
jgi:lysophospholipase L1-like esterase